MTYARGPSSSHTAPASRIAGARLLSTRSKPRHVVHDLGDVSAEADTGRVEHRGLGLRRSNPAKSRNNGNDGGGNSVMRREHRKLDGPPIDRRCAHRQEQSACRLCRRVTVRHRSHHLARFGDGTESLPLVTRYDSIGEHTIAEFSDLLPAPFQFPIDTSRTKPLRPPSPSDLARWRDALRHRTQPVDLECYPLC